MEDTTNSHGFGGKWMYCMPIVFDKDGSTLLLASAEVLKVREKGLPVIKKIYI